MTIAHIISSLFLFFFFNIYLFIMYTIFCLCMPAGQKRAPDLITDGCEPPCGCWELNSGPLEEQAMLLTTEPSLQPQKTLLKKLFLFMCIGVLPWVSGPLELEL